MKSVVDYLSVLLKDIKSKEKRIEECTDPYEKVGHNHELTEMKEQLKNAANLLGNAYTSKELLELCKGIMPDDVQKKIYDQMEEKNRKNEKSYINYQKQILDVSEKDIAAAFDLDPDCDKESSPVYKKYKAAQDAFDKALQNIENPKYNKVNFLSLVGPEYYDEYIKKLAANLVNVDGATEIEKNILSYQVVYKSEKSLEYPVKDKLDNMIISMSGISYETHQLINENYNFINEITSIESSEGSRRIYDYVSKIEPIVEKENLNNFIEGSKDKGLEDIAYDNAMGFKEFEHVESEKRVYNDELNLEFSDNVKILYSTLLKEMQNTNMLPDNASIDESGIKAYGFTKFLQARKKLIDTINAENFDENEFRIDLDNIKREVRKIENMENLIERKIGTSFESMPTNVDTFRNQHVPRRFKQNLAHNAQINGLYISLGLINKAGVTIDQFVQNPTEVVKKAFDDQFDELHIDNKLKGRSKAEAIYDLAGGKKFETIGVYGYLRAIEFFAGLETDPEKKKHNTVVIAGMLSNFSKKQMVLDAAKSGYMNNANISETLQNIFLAKPDENGNISYADCHSKIIPVSEKENPEYVSRIFDYKTGYSIKDKETAIDKIAKIENFQETYYDMMAVIKKYNTVLKNPDNKVKPNVEIKDLINAAQELCAKYLLIHDINELDKNFQKEVMNFIKNPSLEETIRVVNTQGMENPSLEKLVKGKKSLISKKEKDIKSFVTRQEQAFIKTFKELNKQMDALDKQVDKISKKIGKGETNAEIEAIGMQHRKLLNQLMEAQNARIDKLQNEYENGMISKYYYEKRVEQVKTLQNIDKIPPLFQVDEPQYDKFKSYKKALSEKQKSGKTDEELLEEYNELKASLTNEKMSYLVSLVCSDKGIKSLKSLNSKNEFAVKSDLIEINEEVYKKESEDLIKENTKIKALAEHKQAIVVEEVLEPHIPSNDMRLNESNEIVSEKSFDLVDL